VSSQVYNYQKLLLIIIAAFTTSTNAQSSDWIYAGGSEDGSVAMMSVSSILYYPKTPYLISAWFNGYYKNVLTFPNSPPIASSKIQFMFNCTSRRYIDLSSIYYGKNGSVVKSFDDAGQWRAAAPGTFIAQQMSTACQYLAR